MKLERQFIKFIIIGCKSTLINYLFYLVLYKTTANILLASISGYFAGNINSYIFGKKWVFKNSKIKNNFIFFKFLMVYLFGAFLFSSTINYLSIKGLDHKIAWLIGIVFCILNNFLGSKYIVFKK
tara:strand:+ start:4881 stop:5255 length:375 start_codon:yes stop_codon:yes gene_type:complete